MISVPSAFARALGQLGDRRVLGVMVKSMAVTLAIVALMAAGLWRGTIALAERYAPAYGEAGHIGAVLVALVLGWLAFRIVALAVLQFFADDVVRAVELRHYPGEHAAARDIPIAEEARNPEESQ